MMPHKRTREKASAKVSKTQEPEGFVPRANSSPNLKRRTRNLVSERAAASAPRKISAGSAEVAGPQIMSRNFYILAGTLVFFALISAGMSLMPSSFQPGLPANGSLWRTIATFFLLCGLVSALIGVMSHLFEQVERRNEEARLAARRKRRG